jgi:hypothetical protein
MPWEWGRIQSPFKTTLQAEFKILHNSINPKREKDLLEIFSRLKNPQKCMEIKFKLKVLPAANWMKHVIMAKIKLKTGNHLHESQRRQEYRQGRHKIMEDKCNKKNLQ